MSDHWEYKTIDYAASQLSGKLKAEPLEVQLNELGRAGWELVSTVPNNYMGLVLILKRKR